jgi:hypothetical protein
MLDSVIGPSITPCSLPPGPSCFANCLQNRSDIRTQYSSSGTFAAFASFSLSQALGRTSSGPSPQLSSMISFRTVLLYEVDPQGPEQARLRCSPGWELDATGSHLMVIISFSGRGSQSIANRFAAHTACCLIILKAVPIYRNKSMHRLFDWGTFT